MEKSEGSQQIQYDPDPVEHALEGKKRFLVDGIMRRRPTQPNVKNKNIISKPNQVSGYSTKCYPSLAKYIK